MCKNVNPPLVPGVQVRLVHLAVLPYHVGQVFHPNRMCLAVPEFQAVQDHQEDQVGLVVRSGEEGGKKKGGGKKREIMGREKWKGRENRGGMGGEEGRGMGAEEGRDEGEEGERTEQNGEERKPEVRGRTHGWDVILTVCGYISHQELHHCHYLL